jgi:hypothetical protein
MIKRYRVDAASIGELYDELPGEVVNAQDYDALAAELAKEAKWRKLTQAGAPFRELRIQADRIRALEGDLARCRAANVYDAEAHKRDDAQKDRRKLLHYIEQLEQRPNGCSVHGECPVCRANRVAGDPRVVVTQASGGTVDG